MVIAKKGRSLFTYCVAATFAALILFGTWNRLFAAAALLLSVVMVMACPKILIVGIMVFIAPMATIFKLGPTSQSCYTYLLLFFVLWELIRNKNVPNRVASIMLFCCYLVVVQIINDSLSIKQTIKFIANFLFLVWANIGFEKKARVKILDLFVWGVIVSSIFGLLDSSIFRITEYVRIDTDGYIFEGDHLARFTGVAADPNYYAVNVILALCIVVYQYFIGAVKIPYVFVTGGLLTYFSTLTLSKSAIIMLMLPLFLLLYTFFQKRQWFYVFMFMVGTGIAAVVVASGRISSLNVIITRFTTSGNDISTITTGRSDLWIVYMEELMRTPIQTFFGRGIGARLLYGGPGPHNTYVDVLYYLGVVGTIWFVSLIIPQNEGMADRIKLINFGGYLTILIMYFFLSALLYYDLPIHILLANMLLKNRDRECELKAYVCN